MNKIGKLVYEVVDEFEIYQVREHFEVYRNGKWFESADTIKEALQDVSDEMGEE